MSFKKALDVLKARTGVIPLDHKVIHDTVTHLLHQNKHNRGEDDRYTKMQPVRTQMPLTDATGKKHDVTVHLTPGSRKEGEPGISGRHEKHDYAFDDKPQHHIKLYTQGTGHFHNWLVGGLKNILSHEATHAADPSLKRQGPRGDKDYGAYVNHPPELNARMQQIHHEITHPGAIKRVQLDPKTYHPEHILHRYSGTWGRIRPHLTPENRKRVLKMAAHTHNAVRSGDIEDTHKSFWELAKSLLK